MIIKHRGLEHWIAKTMGWSNPDVLKQCYKVSTWLRIKIWIKRLFKL